MWVIVSLAMHALTYRPANIFLHQTADVGQVIVSIRGMQRVVYKARNPLIRRNESVTSVSDDIVFDALAGSRVGTVSRSDAIVKLDKWDDARGLDAFNSSLRRAQATVRRVVARPLGYTRLRIVISATWKRKCRSRTSNR
jgi:hypothetical protein